MTIGIKLVVSQLVIDLIAQLAINQSVRKLVIQVVPLGKSVGNINVDVVTGHLWVTVFPRPKFL